MPLIPGRCTDRLESIPGHLGCVETAAVVRSTCRRQLPAKPRKRMRHVQPHLDVVVIASNRCRTSCSRKPRHVVPRARKKSTSCRRQARYCIVRQVVRYTLPQVISKSRTSPASPDVSCYFNGDMLQPFAVSLPPRWPCMKSHRRCRRLLKLGFFSHFVTYGSRGGRTLLLRGGYSGTFLVLGATPAKGPELANVVCFWIAARQTRFKA